MIELLVRLQQLRLCCQKATQNNQLSEGEKNSIRFFKCLVRDCLPSEVLDHYDRLKEAEPELLQCPDVFAMAVLVSTYRSLPSRRRQRLVDHFGSPLTASICPGSCPARPRRISGRQLHATRGQLVVRH